HIITMSAGAGLFGVPFRGVHTASKFAQETLFEALYYELAPLGIRVSIVKPGAVATPAADRVPRVAAVLDDYRQARQRLGPRYDKLMRTGMPPSRVAQTVLRIANSPHPRLRYRVGSQVRVLAAVQRLVPEPLFAAALRRVLAAVSREQNQPVEADPP